MKSRRSFFTLMGLTLVLGATTALTAPQDGQVVKDDKAKVGNAAPAFTLNDTEGKEVSLSDFEGHIVVLQWINPQCPVCVRCMESGLVTAMAKELKELDANIVHLAINSTHSQTPEHTAEYLKEYKLEVPGLVDSEGKVGKLYGAKTTPHMFVIDAEGVLRYAGAFDNDPRGSRDDATNYAVNAVKLILAGETVEPAETKPYGCNVKYKPITN